MNKIILTIAVATLLFSCKKDEANTFSATDRTGETTIQGKITHEDYESGNDIALAGAKVTVRIENSDLYPNSPNAQGSEIYSGISDEQGNYTITAKTNGEGVTARITYSPVTLTVDPTTGEQETYSNDETTNITLFKGVDVTNDKYYDSDTSVDFSDIVIETAIVRGTLEIQHWLQDEDNDDLFTLENLPLTNHTVTLVYDQDPTTLQERIYETVSDENGDYSFSIETANYDYDLDNDYEVILPVFDTTQDSILVNTVVLSSNPGVYGEESLSGEVEGGSIENARDLLYNNFQAD